MSLLIIHLIFVGITVGMIVFSITILKSKAPIFQEVNDKKSDDDDDGGLGIDLRDFPDFDLPPGVYLESEGDTNKEEVFEDDLVL